MARMSMINCVIFLLGQVIFLTVIKVTCDSNVLETTILTETNEEIALRWVETEPFLANDNLPIWLTDDSTYIKQDVNIMKEIGKFKTYHDVEKSSAIILIEKWNCIYGVIDVRYTIACLPLNELYGHQHKIGENPNLIVMGHHIFPNHEKPINSLAVPSTDTATSTSNNFKMLIKTFVDSDKPSSSHHSGCTQHEHDQTVGVSATSDDAPPAKKRRPQMKWNYEEQVITVYPEILIFISHEIVRTAQHLITIVVRYLVQLNAVAMLFAKLATHNIKIHINIAGLVIETNYNHVLPTSLFDNSRPSGSTVLNSITQYISEMRLRQSCSRNAFAGDSFDMFILSTMNEWQERETISGGISTAVYNLKSIRKISTSTKNKKYLGSVVDATNIMHHYVNVAREIAHLMTVEDDPLNNYDSCYNGEQCHSIMHVINRYCPNCLSWSEQSVKSFEKYLSENTNRCFLRNLPRSLHPYDQPIKLLTPADQCFCFGHYPDMETTHLDTRLVYHVCKKSIRCAVSETEGKLIYVTPPMDGTPCDKKDDTKVCWRLLCVPTTFGGN